MANLPGQLKEQLKSHNVIPFVGAGVSMSVKDKQTGGVLFPIWKGLLENAVERLREEDRLPYAEAVSGLIGIGPDEYLEAAKRARQGMTGGNWFRFLKEQLDVPFENVDSASLDLARAIWNLGSSLIVTTNYDRVLHWARPEDVDLRTWDIESPAEQAGALRADPQRPTVWHLHGTIDNAASMILTPDGYGRLYPDAGDGETKYKAALLTLRQLMMSHTFLFIGGKRPGKRGRGAEGKTIVMGMVERGGKVKAKVVPDVKARTLVPEIQSSVPVGTAVLTDDLPTYRRLSSLGYRHDVVPHSRGVYVVGKDIHTNSIEGFWSQLKRSIDGSYHHVTTHHLQKYVDGYAFRYSHRNDEQNMFWTMMERVISQAS